MTLWRNRIVEFALVPPDQLTAHPLNAKLHPGRQRDVMRTVLDDVGWIGPVIENVTTGYVIDGHMRLAEALTAGESRIPVLRVELSIEEEAEALVTHDAIGQLARWEQERLDDLIAGMDASPMVDELIADLHGVTPATMPEPEMPGDEIIPEFRSLCAVYPADRYREVVEQLGGIPGDTVGQKLCWLLERHT